MRAFTVVLSVALLAQASNGALCTVSNMTNVKDPSQSSTLRITNQTELDVLASCETLDGSIEVSPDYIGPILLRGVKNLTGSFFFETNASNGGTANITSLDLPDLVYADTVSVKNVTMDSIYLPNATLINHLELYSLHGPNGTSLNFPVLANATTIHACGTISSMEFPQLLSVSETLQVSGNPNCYELYETLPPVNATFPSLIEATDLVLVGNFTSINMPNLTTVTPGPTDGLRVISWGNTIPLVFPKLTNSSITTIAGYWNSQALLPVLLDVPNYLNVSTITQNDIQLSLTSVKDLYLSGDISKFYLVHLKTFEKIVITSSFAGSCSDTENLFIGTTDYPGSTSKRTYACHGPSPPGSWKISTGGIVGIVLAALVVVIVISALLWNWSVKRRSAKLDKDIQRTREEGFELRDLSD